MTAPFVNQLRTESSPITIGAPTSGALHFRVQVAETWNAVRVDANASETVRAVKLNALDALCGGALFPDDYVVKLLGWEIFDEGMSLQEAGVVDGSVLLVQFRRRRPVR